MRLLIDLQGAQATNAHRGIGRYALALTEGIVRHRQEDEIHLLLNSRFAGPTVALRETFTALLPPANIHVFASPAPQTSADDAWCAGIGAIAREAAISMVDPDVLLVTSHFEGFHDGVITGGCPAVPTAAVLYDLIPHVFPDHYLSDHDLRTWYDQKVRESVDIDLLLAISAATRRDALEHLARTPDSVRVISSAVDPAFQPADGEPDRSAAARRGLVRPFLMYTGGIDVRKNIEALIRSYAQLPAPVRERHQVAIVCAIRDSDRRRLSSFTASLGLKDDAVVFTGYVDDVDLLALYRSCVAFVFPSWYEGFGLPVLEAMQCGRAAIGADSSSIAEVIGRADALFDPHDDASIASLVERVLVDTKFRTELEHWGLTRSRDFSWDRTALVALDALRALPRASSTVVPEGPRRPRLAMVSPFPPTPSGISDYTANLLPHLARHYDIELVVADQPPEAVGLELPAHGIDWFRDNHHHFDRVLYHFGNSEFHQHMFDLLAVAPGAVVLHDFFLSSIVRHMDLTGAAPGHWPRTLYQSHGYRALHHLDEPAGDRETMWRFPANLQVLQDADGVIVHSEYSRRLAAEWYGAGDPAEWQVVPLMRPPARVTSAARAQARRSLGFAEHEVVVCAFGMTGPTKLNHELARAFAASTLPNTSTRLLFVGPGIGGDYDELLDAVLAELGDPTRFRAVGRVHPALFRTYLLAADIAVQLRSNSRGETSAAVLDCMNAALPVIVNANGAQGDLPPDAVFMIPDRFSNGDLVEALDRLASDRLMRGRLGARAARHIKAHHDPATCAAAYIEAIERFAAKPHAHRSIARRVRALPAAAPMPFSRLAAAEALARTIPRRPRTTQLLVDVSELVLRDAATGIQRVVKSLLDGLLAYEPSGMRVEPVYAGTEHGYRYARGFTARFLGIEHSFGQDEPIDFTAGDVFLGLDLAPEAVTRNAAFFEELRAAGTTVHFVLYDLLPVLLPSAFIEGAVERHTRWLDTIARADGVLCISEAVAGEMREWLAVHAPQRVGHLRIGAFHLGADFHAGTTTIGYPDDAVTDLLRIANRPTFTMVGTVEPRKGHRQVLGGFERLWANGIDVNLVIVGKPGWMMDDFVETLSCHPELHDRLHWLHSASDEYLETAYRFTDCLIVASLAEGFGLSIVEGALHDLPLLIRDITVFRDLAGQHAQYFSGDTADEIEAAVLEWLDRARRGVVIESTGVPIQTWRMSTEQLLAELGINALRS